MGRTKDGLNSVNWHKKHKAVTTMWRPVSTHSGSHEVQVVNELKTDLRSEEQVKEEELGGTCSNKDAELVNENHKCSVSVEVDAALIRFVKGKWGATQRQIEEESGVKIIFPSSKEDTSIVIEGVSTESVTKASKRVANVLEEAVKSPSLDYSHFISLPLAIHPELVEKLNSFQNFILGDASSSNDCNPDSDSNEEISDSGKDGKQSESTNVVVKFDVQEEKERVNVKIDDSQAPNITLKYYPIKEKTYTSYSGSDTGIDKSIFIKPRTFHLTVLMLKLWNKDRIDAATEVLQKVSSKVNAALEGRPLSIRLKGLECMRGSPAKARVLYAPVEEIGGEGRLLRACQVIIEAYVEAGFVLVKDAQQTLKLHATLMNARHRKWKKGVRTHDSFDARGIIRRYGSEEWGDYLIREAQLSQRFSFDESGYYHCCSSIRLPEKPEN